MEWVTQNQAYEQLFINFLQSNNIITFITEIQPKCTVHQIKQANIHVLYNIHCLSKPVAEVVTYSNKSNFKQQVR